MACLTPFLTRIQLAGKLVRKPSIIAICIISQNTGESGSGGEAKKTRDTNAIQAAMTIPVRKTRGSADHIPQRAADAGVCAVVCEQNTDPTLGTCPTYTGEK